MILLLGGITETAAIANALANAGHSVLVSTATEAPLKFGTHPQISRRCGRLDLPGMIGLIHQNKIRLLIDAAHPYAVEVHATANSAADQCQIPRLSYTRPPSMSASADAQVASTHDEAARLACASGGPVLLTVGSRNIGIYAEHANRAGVSLVARVLDCAESLAACQAAGIPRERTITGRGPFTVDENRALIRRFHIQVIVTKDGGDAGGFTAKEQAAQLESCHLIVVCRPPLPTGIVFDNIPAMVNSALDTLAPTTI